MGGYHQFNRLRSMIEPARAGHGLLLPNLPYGQRGGATCTCVWCQRKWLGFSIALQVSTHRVCNLTLAISVRGEPTLRTVVERWCRALRHANCVHLLINGASVTGVAVSVPGTSHCCVDGASHGTLTVYSWRRAPAVAHAGRVPWGHTGCPHAVPATTSADSALTETVDLSNHGTHDVNGASTLTHPRPLSVIPVSLYASAHSAALAPHPTARVMCAVY